MVLSHPTSSLPGLLAFLVVFVAAMVVFAVLMALRAAGV